MKDYYKILGVDEEASGEEIRDRWIELTKRYHPDLSKGSDDEENIKEINEAYEVLKDFSKRLDYDLERTLKRSLIKKAYKRKEKKSHIRKILLPVGIIVFFLIVGLVIFRWPHIAEPPQSEAPYEIDKILEKKIASPIPPTKPESEVKVGKEVSKEMEEVMPQETTKIVSTPSQSTPFVGEREPKRGEESERKILPKSEEPSPPSLSQMEEEPKRKEEPILPVVRKPETPAKGEKEVPREIPREVLAKEEPKRKEEPIPPVVMKPEAPAKVEKEVPREIPKEVLAKEEPKRKEEPIPPVVRKPETPAKVEKEVPREIPKEVPKEVRKDLPKEITKVTLRPGEKIPETWVVSAPSPSFAKEEEVKQFFSNYIDRYNRKDIHGFLSFFSSKAVQNQKEGFERIRKIYSDFFDQSQELQYHMEDTKIEIYQNGIEVRARYKLDQLLKKGGERKRWIGNIRWVLVKEDGVLRIISLDYKNEKSP